MIVKPVHVYSEHTIIITFLLMQVIIICYKKFVVKIFCDMVQTMKNRLFLLLIFAFGALILPANPVAAKEELSNRIYPLPPTRIADYIKFTKGQKRALLIYTSWCPYCRKKIPDMIKMENYKEGSIIAISEDQNYTNFSKYIRSLENIPYNVILSNPKGSDTLIKALEQFGVRAWRSYPTVVLLDENNKVVKQGNMRSNYIENFLFSE